MPSEHDVNIKARAGRLVREHCDAYGTEWAAVRAVSARLGMSAETLCKGVRQAEVDAGEAAGVPFAGLITGWECSLTKNTAFVERAIRQAAAYRARQGHRFTGNTIHHSDAGSQYTAIHFTETLMLQGLIPSVGTVGDALDNALAETTIGLYKTECVREGSPFRTGALRTLADVEDITSAWVHWYNTARLMHRLGRRPPAEAEAEYCQRLPVAEQPGQR